MTGPRLAHFDADCEECSTFIAQDDPVYFADGGKLCERCAEKLKIVCPKCKGQKKAEFYQCYSCTKEDGIKSSKADGTPMGKLKT